MLCDNLQGTGWDGWERGSRERREIYTHTHTNTHTHTHTLMADSCCMTEINTIL